MHFLSYHAATIAQSLVQEFAQNKFEICALSDSDIWNKLDVTIFPRFSPLRSASFQLLYYYSDERTKLLI